MNRARIIVAILFAGLLVSSVLLSGGIAFRTTGDTGNLRSQSLKKYGFYLDVVNKEAGIDFRHTPPDLDPRVKHIASQIASMGAAVSICDFDNDGWNDIYLTSSSNGSHNALYRNLHNGKFQDIADSLGIGDVNKAGTGSSMGAVWGDFDNDGYQDLLLYKWGKPELFRNDSGRRFINVTEDSGLPAWVNANSAIWLDFDNDGLLDLFIGGYYSEQFDLQHLKTSMIMPESFRYANNGGRNYLLKNLGHGHFQDVTRAYGLTSTRWVLAAGAADFTGDGYPDLFVSDDYNVDEFYINDSGKRFVEEGRKAGIGFIPKSGMNVAFGDLDNSGLTGIYTTNITEQDILIQGNNYWKPKNPHGAIPSFVNLARLAGIENAGWSYGAQFGDLDNDGNQDLYVANGFISGKKATSYWYDYSKVIGGNKAIIGNADNWPAIDGKSQSGYQQDKIWLNEGNGLFKDVSGDVCPYSDYDGRAVALADLWNRGVLDVIVANQNNIPLVYKNTVVNGNHWIDFDLHGTVSNADAVGAGIVLQWNGHRQVQVVTGGIGFSSQNQHRLHFGLGAATRVDKAVITWPSGHKDEIANPAIDSVHVIIENKSRP
jgi:hypothetical protein